jgi:hypothetical protein
MYILIGLVLIFYEINSKLLGALEFNRHGARTPKEFVSISSDLFFGSVASQLTFNGYNQHLLLGKWVKENYSELFSKKFNKDEVLFLSSPIERTIFSAFAFIKGMYSDIEIIPRITNSTMKTHDVPPIANFHLKTPFTPAELIINLKDSLFHACNCRLRIGDHYSDRLGDLRPKIDIFLITNDEIRNTVDELKDKIPDLTTNQTDIYTYDFLTKIPGLYLPVYYHYGDIYNISAKSFEVIRKTQINRVYQTRFQDCPVKKLILSHLFDVFKSSLNRFEENDGLKFVLFSGHDTNQADLLSSLLDSDYFRSRFGTTDEDYYFVMPRFASSIFLELHDNDDMFLRNRKYIKIMFNGVEIKGKFREPLVYDDNLGGIIYESFLEFLSMNIDYRYKELVCDYVDDKLSSSSEREYLTRSYLLRNI